MLALAEQIKKELASRTSVQVNGSTKALRQLLLTNLVFDPHAPQTLLLIVPTLKDFSTWIHFCEATLSCTIAALPHYSLWGHDRYLNHANLKRQRLLGLSLFQSSGKKVIVTTIAALLQKTIARADFIRLTFALREQDRCDLAQLQDHLEERGYQKISKVDEAGTFAIRGGIVDIFPVNSTTPFRLELFDDSIASIRTFSVNNQRSGEAITAFTVAPAHEIYLPKAKRKDNTQKLYEVLLEQKVPVPERNGMVTAFGEGIRFSGLDMFGPLFFEQPSTAFDYLPNDVLFIFPDSIETCTAAFEHFFDDAVHSCELDRTNSKPVLLPHEHFHAKTFFHDRISPAQQLEFSCPFNHKGFVVVNGLATPLPLAANPQGRAAFDQWIDLIRNTTGDGGSVLLLAESNEERDKLRNLLEYREVAVANDDHALRHLATLRRGITTIGIGSFDSYFWDEGSRLLVVDAQLILATPKRKKKLGKKLDRYFNSFKDLKIDDLVVHVDHGIGRYLGIFNLNLTGSAGDFLVIQYYGGDKIYLPVDRLDKLQKYVGNATAEQSKALDKLGTGAWNKKKELVAKSVRNIAADLLKTQAQRNMSKAFRYPPPGDIYTDFVNDFPFEETEDQERSIAEIEADLQSERPMDRLIVGDVGFGKTEVALRAAMRAILEGRQVLVLVPTTVLCYQQYTVFRDRLEKHGVRVAQINRFVNRTQQKETIDALAQGKLDVLVGTHRLLSKDVKPKNLGLLVVDEEQRFGVVHKERLKTLKVNADVLTLSATPIPRTLHLAMLGLRDISIIATPPHDRLPIKTFVVAFDEGLLVEAVMNEVNKGGQVFFVHNRVDNLDETCNQLRKLLPHVSMRVAHGQMKEHQLENVIVDFIEQKFQMLVCTTIIESGIDMPNVNTLLVNRSDQFGLAQLYQLRGRVGRSSTQAYAYFFTSSEKINDDARKRLEILATYQDLGAGFQISQYDMELRGVGDLLGSQQSGHIASVGFDLYMDMLNSTIDEINGTVESRKSDPEIKIKVTALIPPTYIESESERLSIYKRIFSADADSELTEINREIADRFGSLPPQFQRLIKVAMLKLRLRDLNALMLLPVDHERFEIRFGPLSPQVIAILSEMANKTSVRGRTDYELTADFRLLLRLAKAYTLETQDGMLSNLLALIDPIVQRLNP